MNDYTDMHSPDAEMSVLGALLLSPDAIDRIGELTEGDFFIAAHRSIFRRIASMHANRRGVDVVTVADALQELGELEPSGGFGFVAELAANATGAANVQRYAEIVIEKRMLRDLSAVAGEIVGLATATSGLSAMDRIDQAQSKMLELSKIKDNQSGPIDIGSMLPAFIAELERRSEIGGGITGLATGFQDLDDRTKGLQPGSLIIIAGRPSMGKTTFALNIAERAAMNGKTALVFSMEMPRTQIIEKCAASIGGIDLDAIGSGRLSGEDFSRVTTVMSKLDGAGLVVDDSSALGVSQMSGRARRVKRRRGQLDLIVIDYLQLMSGGKGRASNRNEELGEITRGLKLMARDLGVPVIALSQLSRKVEDRTDKRPMMSDLRESGAIEQDADLILMAYRDDYYHPESPFKGLAEILIRKHRMGAVGDIKLVFQGQYSRFLDADNQAIAAACRAAAETKAKPKDRGFHV